MSEDIKIYVDIGNGEIKPVKNTDLTADQLSNVLSQIEEIYEQRFAKGGEGNKYIIPNHIKTALLNNGTYHILGLGDLLFVENTRKFISAKFILRFKRRGYVNELKKLEEERSILMQTQQQATRRTKKR